ncbi:translation initiation factor IF-3 [Thermosulfidibacter takaii ABI70S6]|uniref:Translation initiation factor IF-3 n=1 Tax=Thermosulfidibacter takaii (strain DSM 17441 / JCM 13301 / NBRC 103674 / ABI70S6) TaxID=1298851 RepID=A0A0S3QUR6_THET7|nr:translation initiation factor IF-3 [Thermosulfidibacter takaii ABI70S6]
MANEQIKVKEVRVISPDGRQLGVMPTKEALNLARDAGYDLILVAPNANPPVCRMMDLGKYKYELKKKAKEAKKKQRVIEVKELRFRPKIEEHDYQVKLKHAREFLGDGDKVKIVMRFRGREMAFVDTGREVLSRLAKDLEDVAVVEKRPDLEGNQMIMVLAPKHHK